ncbi:MAG: alkaline phosphatase [Porticoccaceae bacterium]|nr:alkaline phosphatase [Porticoccaceae bacterium]
MNKPTLFLILTIFLLLSGWLFINDTENKSSSTSGASSEILNTIENSWYTESAAAVASTNSQIQRLATQAGSAKNIILFVGDGMGVSTVTAARILDGQQKGGLGEENSLSFDRFPFVGLSKTYNVDAQTPDSAGTMTAMISGIKTDAGTLGVDEDVIRGDCASIAGNQVFTALELAEIAGLSTGIVTTARVTHATPAATYAKSPERDWEDNSELPAEAVAAGCEDIASQLIHFKANLQSKYNSAAIDGIEVVMGGGRRHFLPNLESANSSDAVSEIEGDRTDGRNLVEEWASLYPSGIYIDSQQGFDKLDTSSTEQLFALFNESHMRYAADRHNDIAGEPSLSAMTVKAIEILDNNPAGFLLVVESGRIDHGHHAGSAYAALEDTIEFSRAVQSAVDKTNAEETLIIVTADHSHVFTMAGYPKRGNPILGKVINVGSDKPALAADGMPYTTLGYANGLGFRDLLDQTDADHSYHSGPVAGRQDLSEIDTETAGFHQEALVPRKSETHGGEDVAIYATGPGAHLVTGTNEQSVIFHVINYAGNLFERAAAALQ